MRRPPVGIADLAVALRALKPNHEEGFAIAGMLGLDGRLSVALPAAELSEREESPRVVPDLRAYHPTRPSTPDYSRHSPPEHLRSSVSRARSGNIRHRQPDGPETNLPSRLTELRASPTGKMPAYVANAEPVSFPPTARSTNPPQPAVPHDQLRALVADLVKVPVPGGPDLPRLIDQLARGKLLRVVPREIGDGTARSIHVVVDRGGVMDLFQRDVEDILRALRRVTGSSISSVRSISLPSEEGLPRTGSRGDLLLAISDLGMGSKTPVDTGRLKLWTRFALRQNRQGVNVVAVVPFTASRWPRGMKRAMRLVHLYAPGHAATPTSTEEIANLARALSLAAVVDPAILREARVRVLPRASVEAEADFISGRWVSGHNSRVVVMDSAAIVKLRGELGQDPNLLEEARAALLRCRPKTPEWARVSFEEQLTGVVLRAGETEPDAGAGGLARLIKSLNSVADTETARWALHLIDELPVRTQTTESAELLKAVASLILETDLDEVSRIVQKYNAGWIFGKLGPVGVAWTGQQILVREPPLPGDHLLNIPIKGPRVLIVSVPDGQEHVIVQVFRAPDPPDSVRIAGLPMLLTTSTGAQYRLESRTAEWDRLVRALNTNSLIDAKVIWRTNRRWTVDIGFKAPSRASKPYPQLGESDVALAGMKLPADLTGKVLKVCVTALDPVNLQVTVALPRLESLVGSTATWQSLANAYKRREHVTGVVVATGEFGYSVRVLDALTYVPDIEFPPSEKPRRRKDIEGHRVTFCIPQFSFENRELVLSRLFEEFASWQPFLDAKDNDQPIMATVVRAGLKAKHVRARVGTKTAIIRSERMDTVGVQSLASIGKTLPFKVVNLDWRPADDGSRRIFVSPVDRADDLPSRLKPGLRTSGRVTRITEKGVYVDLGDIVGMVYLRDLSWSPIGSPLDVVSEGDERDFVVLSVNSKRHQVTLGLKQATPNPAVASIAVGQVHHGTVAGITNFGAFVDVGGAYGLLHNSHLSWSRYRTAQLTLKSGDELDVIVLAIEGAGRKRLSLGHKELIANPWEHLPAHLAIGKLARGRVLGLIGLGVLITLDGELDGLIELRGATDSAAAAAHPALRLNRGEDVEVEILSIEPTNQLILLRLIRVS